MMTVNNFLENISKIWFSCCPVYEKQCVFYRSDKQHIAWDTWFSELIRAVIRRSHNYIRRPGSTVYTSDYGSQCCPSGTKKKYCRDKYGAVYFLKYLYLLRKIFSILVRSSDKLSLTSKTAWRPPAWRDLEDTHRTKSVGCLAVDECCKISPQFQKKLSMNQNLTTLSNHFSNNNNNKKLRNLSNSILSPIATAWAG